MHLLSSTHTYAALYTQVNCVGVATCLPKRLLELLSLRPGAHTQARFPSSTCS